MRALLGYIITALPRVSGISFHAWSWSSGCGVNTRISGVPVPVVARDSTGGVIVVLNVDVVVKVKGVVVGRLNCVVVNRLLRRGFGDIHLPRFKVLRL